MLDFNVVLRCIQKLEKLPKLEISERALLRGPQGPGGKIFIAGVGVISQSDSKIWDSGPLRSWRKS